MVNIHCCCHLCISYSRSHTFMPNIVSRVLTHWRRVTHICVSNITAIGSDSGLSPGRRKAIIRTNAGILLIEPLGTNFNEILMKIHIFSFKKIHFKMSSGKWRPFCLGLNVLSACFQCGHFGDNCSFCRSTQKRTLFFVLFLDHGRFI